MSGSQMARIRSSEQKGRSRDSTSFSISPAIDIRMCRWMRAESF
jgi:hypothetical protein